MPHDFPPDSPWDPAYPIPKNQTPTPISRVEVLSLFHSGKRAGKDFVLVDLRRDDRIGGTISTSLNIPAQTLYPSIPTLYSLFASAKVERVIWYCGSSQHRGLRAAAWMDDYITAQGGVSMKSLVLTGGVKGWAGAGEEYIELMDGYDKDAW
ncbi:arsenate reductase [Lentithecium fluviatile CBS 122367]|uniref:Arsenate reductase n=1 Tax=Lentithecium fluviatile CBS 122367 TaxID=1168545 RepID=A0A6G1JA53_9PLEO|nr:arsenate reductase [Lentithecium fluviatile CBS 122367]